MKSPGAVSGLGTPGRTGDAPDSCAGAEKHWGHSWGCPSSREGIYSTEAIMPAQAELHLELICTWNWPLSVRFHAGKLIQGEAPTTHPLMCFCCTAATRNTQVEMSEPQRPPLVLISGRKIVSEKETHPRPTG